MSKGRHYDPFSIVEGVDEYEQKDEYENEHKDEHKDEYKDEYKNEDEYKGEGMSYL